MSGWSGEFADMTVPWPKSAHARVFDLAVALEPGMTKHPYHPPYSFVLAKKHGEGLYPGGISSAMEMITMGAHVGTHVDALGHIGVDGMVHGERPILEHQSSTAGLEYGSTEECPPLIGRGHLIDAVELLGRDLTPADGIGVAELEKWYADHPEPDAGSVVLVRTGWMRYWRDSDRYLGLETGLPGMKREGAEWLSSRGILATGSDTVNYEHKPDVKTPALSVHQHNLVERGIYILECLNLETLAAHRAYDFMFVALPLRIRGRHGFPAPSDRDRGADMSTPTVREEDEMELSPDDIRRVLEALDASEWDEAVITVGDVRIAVARNGASLPIGQNPVPTAPAAVVEPASAPAPAPATAPAAPAPVAAAAPAASSSAESSGPTLLVTAPSVGVFWRSPEPAAPPFVEIGQHVKAGDTMGIVEVMKLMSHVDAPAAGTVIEIHVENAHSVEHGSPLFTLALEEG